MNDNRPIRYKAFSRVMYIISKRNGLLDNMKTE